MEFATVQRIPTKSSTEVFIYALQRIQITKKNPDVPIGLMCPIVDIFTIKGYFHPKYNHYDKC